MPRVHHFEIHATDPERAIAFYQRAFGWTFTRWDGAWPYWLVITGPADEPGINGGLLPRRGPAPIDGQPVNAYVCTLRVDSVDAAVESALAAGGTVALPKMVVPGVGWLGYVKDTEGNILGLMQYDHTAD